MERVEGAPVTAAVISRSKCPLQMLHGTDSGSSAQLVEVASITEDMAARRQV